LNRNLQLSTCWMSPGTRVPLLATLLALGWLARVQVQAQNPPTA